MKNYLIAFGISIIFASIASANMVTINTNKVVFNQGISKEDIVKKMQCLIILKEIKEGETTKERVFEQKMKKIHRICEKYKIDEEKCGQIKKHVAMETHACFVGAHFLKEFFGKESPEEEKQEGRE